MKYSTHITPAVKPFTFPNIWRWRYLIYLFVKKDFAVYFQQTILGPLWYLLQPLASTVVLSVVFGRIARLPTDTIPPWLFYLLGSIIWFYFSDCLTRIAGTFKANTHEFGCAAFPRLIVPVAAMFSAFIQFSIQGALFLFTYLWYYNGSLSLLSNIFLIFPGILQLALVGIGCGTSIAALTSKYLDLSHLVRFGMQLLYFCTPLVYPLSMVPQQWRPFFCLNPLTSVLEIMRKVFFNVSALTIKEYMIGWGITILLLLCGLLLFNVTEKKHVDTV